MKIEFQFNSVQIENQEQEEYLPNIISAIQAYPVIPGKRNKKKPRKKKETVGLLIQEIIDSIEK